MKRNSNSRKYNTQLYESFDDTDTRYYGVFLRGRGEDRRVLVDQKRYNKLFNIPEKVMEVMDRHDGPLFHPAKKRIMDYNINFLKFELSRIKQEWTVSNKQMITRVISETQGKKFMPFDDELAQSGILNSEEAVDNARMKTWISESFAEIEKKRLYYSLYAQFFHQMVSQIEALQIKILTKNGYEGDKFNRNVLYAFKGNTQESVKCLAGFIEYDKMYAIWNFIKHNSLSTFYYLKENFQDILINSDYSQGELACFYIDFKDSMIDSILRDVTTFLKNYCLLVFGEDEYEAEWNSEEHFFSVARDEIESRTNPLGIPFWV